MWEEIVSAIRKGKKFVLTTHVNPDGDGIGSQVALAKFLRKIGKEATVMNCNEIEKRYSFLDPYNEIRIYQNDGDNKQLYDADVIMVVDMCHLERLGSMVDPVMNSRALKICIDHHPPNRLFADINVINEKAAATGEIVYDLIKVLDGDIDADIACAIYVTLLMDTGSFRFSNTTPNVHRMVAELMEIGNFMPREIYERVFERRSMKRMNLLGHLLLNIQSDCDGKLLWMVLTKELLNDYGISPKDTEGFIDLLSSVDGSELYMLFTELENRKVKVSFRSKRQTDVNKLAGVFGGGGHKHAAGLLIKSSLDEAISIVLVEARNRLSSKLTGASVS